ncbi:MAG TPA: hypothetical protein VNJ01_12175 [Bacteriovoracaceae bacterium]|nr:hypothetical protein [Bacteriovoracaceae bacterium]
MTTSRVLSVTAGLKLHLPPEYSEALPLKPITTMTFYPGPHQLVIQINGKILASKPWTLR